MAIVQLLEMDSSVAWTATLVAVVVALFLFYWWHVLSYWWMRGVPSLPAEPVFGNLRDRFFLRVSSGEVFASFYRRLKPRPYGGVYQTSTPLLVLCDLELIKQVMVKDFQYFQERGSFVDEKRNPLSAHLFNLDGPRWKKLRAKLTPTFTSGKMKMMYNLMHECALELVALLDEPARQGEIVEMKDVVGKYTTDVIGTCAFGLQFNSMKNPDSEFRRMGKAVFEPSRWIMLHQTMRMTLPFLARLLDIRFPSKPVCDFFLGAVKETVDYREKNNIKRNDFMQLLIELKNKAQLLDDYEKVLETSGDTKKEETKECSKFNGDAKINGNDATGKQKEKRISVVGDIELTDGLLAAQAFVFFVAGYETSATTIGFALHELALNPDVQEKLHDEIDRELRAHNGQFTYECVLSMEYLDRVFQETLRKYPPLPVLNRQCTMPYTIPGSKLVLEKGTRVVIPVLGLHTDPEYFPNPEKFDPERFTEEEKAKRPNYVYMPFGEGPRNCIGMRFGQLQTKLGLAVLLHHYKFSPCEKTERKVVLNPKAIFTASVGGNWLQVSHRH